MIVVFEFDAALFFGGGDRLLDEADAPAADCRCLVLHLRRARQRIVGRWRCARPARVAPVPALWPSP
jgi:hypothetical protein